MNRNSNIIFRNFTCIDHAYITSDGYVEGGSFHASAVVSGPVSSDERVVVDFSKGKKLLKSIIDHNKFGYDHKLWIFEDLSDAIIEDNSDGTIQVITSKMSIKVPPNAVKVFQSYDTFIEEMAEMVREALRRELQIPLWVDIDLNTEGFTEQGHYFTYWHGLANSTSWGCQNIAHGHLSFVEVECRDLNNEPIVQEVIASYLNNACIVNREHLRVSTNGNPLIKYESKYRGMMSIEFLEDQKFVILDDEPTIENILYSVMNRYQEYFAKMGVEQIVISEGLQKGAICGL